MPDPIETIVAQPLKNRIETDDGALQVVVIEIVEAADSSGTAKGAACAQVEALVKQAIANAGDRTGQHILSTCDDVHLQVKARLQGKVIKALVNLDREKPVISSVRLDADDGRYFNPDNLIRSVISVPMLRRIEADENSLLSVMIEVNANYTSGRPGAKARVMKLIEETVPKDGSSGFVSDWKTDKSEQYVYAKLTGKEIRDLVEEDQKAPPEDRAIYHIWPDFKLRAQIWRSVATVKADACLRSFATTGRGIVWAVFDSGIDGAHPHFKKYSNLTLPSGLKHMDFTGKNLVEVPADQLTDEYGHGTHVAGIIAGELDQEKDKDGNPRYQAISLSREKDQSGKITYLGQPVTAPVAGVAPQCTILSYKVLDKNGEGDVSTLIAAIQKVQELNGYGRNIVIHGVNMSLGYDFDPEWFACGCSPICVEVDRLVRSGVAVVIAAGNTGKGFTLTINDPGNAELAVTVGATHRDMPHRYGVSYFSSKGPTGDGRQKPDLLAPGERIISCGAGPDLQTYLKKAGPTPGAAGANVAYYLERSGTSMAAPHVSGIIAGILSTRGEFVGLPEEIKDILIKNATDLGRERGFQGGGLVDMMRAMQAV
jgi:serine protease AprX